jgi:hypothetical protein
MLIQGYLNATSPNEKRNYISALTGFVLVLHMIREKKAPYFSEFLMQMMCFRFINSGRIVSNSSTGIDEKLLESCFKTDEADTSNDEIAASAYLSIAYLTQFTGEDTLFTLITSKYLQVLESSRYVFLFNSITKFQKSYPIIFAVLFSEWSAFSAALALCMVYCYRQGSSTSEKGYIDQAWKYISENATDKLAFHPIRRAVGLAFGVSFIVRNAPSLIPEDILNQCRQGIGEFMSSKELPLRAALASWILVSTGEEGDYNLVSSLREVASTESINDLNILGHIMLCSEYAYLHVMKGETLEQELQQHYNAMTSAGVNPLVRVNHLLASFSMMGMDFINPIGMQLGKRSSSHISEIFLKLLILCGSQGKVVNPKLGKIGLLLMSWCLSSWNPNRKSCDPEISFIREPANLNRLTREASTLRHVFDRFSQVERSSYPQYLQALTIEHPLPMVNWAKIISSAWSRDPEATFVFVSRNAPSSYSCMEFLMEKAVCKENSLEDWLRLLGCNGMGVLLKLGGISKSTVQTRGRKGLIIVIPEERIISLTRSIIEILFESQADLQIPCSDRLRLQDLFLETIASCSPDKPAVQGVQQMLSELFLSFFSSYTSLSIYQLGIITELFIHSYGLIDTNLQKAPGRTEEELVHDLSTATHLIRVSFAREKSMPFPQHMSRTSLLSRIAYLALSHTRRVDLHDFIFETIVYVLNSAESRTNDKSMSQAEAQERREQARNSQFADWISKLLDVALLLLKENGNQEALSRSNVPRLWICLNTGGNQVYSNRISRIELCLRKYLLSLLCIDHNEKFQGIPGNDFLWTGQLVYELQTYLLNVQSSKQVNGILRRIVSICKLNDDLNNIFVGIFSHLRYAEESCKEWKLWTYS